MGARTAGRGFLSGGVPLEKQCHLKRNLYCAPLKKRTFVEHVFSLEWFVIENKKQMAVTNLLFAGLHTFGHELQVTLPTVH